MTYDVAIYQPNGSKSYTASLYPGRLLTGLEKLAQRFLLELITDTGSMTYKADRGGNLFAFLKTGASSELDVFHAFNMALLTVATNLQSEEIATDPDNERFGSASLINISLAPGSYTLTISIVSLSGEALNLLWPIQFDMISDINDFSTLGN